MNRCWILLPEDGVLTVRNGLAAPISVVVQPGLHPTVVCGATHIYPNAWNGFIYHGGTVEHWLYPTGPVREIQIRKDNDGRKWVLVTWQSYSQEPLPPCGQW